VEQNTSADMVAVPSFLSSPQAIALFWPLIDTNISDQFSKPKKTACKAQATGISILRKEVTVCFPASAPLAPHSTS